MTAETCKSVCMYACMHAYIHTYTHTHTHPRVRAADTRQPLAVPRVHGELGALLLNILAKRLHVAPSQSQKPDSEGGGLWQQPRAGWSAPLGCGGARGARARHAGGAGGGVNATCWARASRRVGGPKPRHIHARTHTRTNMHTRTHEHAHIRGPDRSRCLDLVHTAGRHSGAHGIGEMEASRTGCTISILFSATRSSSIDGTAGLAPAAAMVQLRPRRTVPPSLRTQTAERVLVLILILDVFL